MGTEKEGLSYLDQYDLDQCELTHIIYLPACLHHPFGNMKQAVCVWSGDR